MRNRQLFIVATAFIASSALAGNGDSVPFPAGYRQWVHIASVVRMPPNSVFDKEPCTKPCVGVVFQYYANDKALEGYRTGKFPDGAIITDEVMELLEAPNQHSTSYDGGPRRGVGVMVKDSSRYAATGGWGFESFKGDNREPGHASAQCYACHNSLRKDHDLTFLSYKE
jgi:hypothetical protein